MFHTSSDECAFLVFFFGLSKLELPILISVVQWPDWTEMSKNTRKIEIRHKIQPSLLCVCAVPV